MTGETPAAQIGDVVLFQYNADTVHAAIVAALLTPTLARLTVFAPGVPPYAQDAEHGTEPGTWRHRAV